MLIIVHRWPEAVPMKDATTHPCAQAFLAIWISRFGIPAHLSSDRGPQFTSAIWASFSQALDIRLHQTTAFHPQANGLVERFCRHLKSALMSCLSGPTGLLNYLRYCLAFAQLLKRISIVLRPILSIKPLFRSQAIFGIPQQLLHRFLILHFFLGFEGFFKSKTPSPCHDTIPHQLIYHPNWLTASTHSLDKTRIDVPWQHLMKDLSKFYKGALNHFKSTSEEEQRQNLSTGSSPHMSISHSQ